MHKAFAASLKGINYPEYSERTFNSEEPEMEISEEEKKKLLEDVMKLAEKK